MEFKLVACREVAWRVRLSVLYVKGGIPPRISFKSMSKRNKIQDKIQNNMGCLPSEFNQSVSKVEVAMANDLIATIFKIERTEEKPN